MLDFAEMIAALVSRDAHHDAEVEILSDAVVQAKKRYSETSTSRSGALRKSDSNMVITVDTPTPFRMSDVTAWLDEQLGRLERTQFLLPYRRLKARIESLVTDQRYNFMFGSLSVQDTMSDVLARLFRVPSEGRPISRDRSVHRAAGNPGRGDLGDLAAGLRPGGVEQGRPAHAAGLRGSPSLCARRRHQIRAHPPALSRIAKEGRKYGLSLALVTQRPCELDATILSQCGTAVALRLSSERDQAGDPRQHL